MRSVCVRVPLYRGFKGLGSAADRFELEPTVDPRAQSVRRNLVAQPSIWTRRTPRAHSACLFSSQGTVHAHSNLRPNPGRCRECARARISVLDCARMAPLAGRFREVSLSTNVLFALSAPDRPRVRASVCNASNRCHSGTQARLVSTQSLLPGIDCSPR